DPRDLPSSPTRRSSDLAFSRRDLADALARDLRLAGVQDVSVKQGNETPSIYRVRAGAFASRDEARALGERLRRERGFSFTVVPRSEEHTSELQSLTNLV